MIKPTGFSIDSRKIEKGNLYFALSGAKVDGHNFLQEVALKGAVGAVVKEDYRGDDFGLALMRVPNVLQELQDRARKTLAAKNVTVVAITGSIGKTTTKEFTAELLSSHFNVAKPPLSYNSQATLPLSILNFSSDAKVYVLEMGMSEPGEIEKLVHIAPPDIAVITTISAQHTTSFSDGILGVAREKGMIFSHPKTTVGILNRDMPCYEMLSRMGSSKKITFSCASKLGNYWLQCQDGAVVMGGKRQCQLPHFLPLKPHYQNFLAAVVVASEMGVPWEAIVEKALHLKLPPMRFQLIEKRGVTFINDAYNANPEATVAALQHLPAPKKGGKKVAVLSEMNALGIHSDEGHQLVAEHALKCVDQVLCIGKKCLPLQELFNKHQKSAFLCETKDALLQELRKVAQVGDVILIKGARFYALEELLEKF